MPTIGEIARNLGFRPVLHIEGRSQDHVIDLWRCPTCCAVVQLDYVTDHKSWHDKTAVRRPK